MTLLVVGIFLLSPALEEEVSEEDGVEMEHTELPLEENGAPLLPVPNKSSKEARGLAGDRPASVPNSTAVERERTAPEEGVSLDEEEATSRGPRSKLKPKQYSFTRI